MSFSTLFELEACPRRWALNSANYPHMWEKQGYPSKPQISALEGSVVHLALQKISNALSKNGCTSLREARAISSLKELGGYTVIITECIDSALHPYEENPRAIPILDTYRQRLITRVPEFRIRIQRHISRINLVSRVGVSLESPSHGINKSRHQLLYGSHPEVMLQVPELGWHGMADLLTLNSKFCEIRDFKSGIPKPQHELQIRIYALLCALDRNLNPYGRLADKLVISYEEKDAEIPFPKKDELRYLEDEIRRRTAEALDDLQANPPEARPSQEICVYCTVRQLCEDYWNWNVRKNRDGESSEYQFADLQIKLSSRHGPTSWDGVVENSSDFKDGRKILLRTSKIPFELQTGQRLRILNIKLNIYQEEQSGDHEPSQIIATVGTNTELFLIA